MNPGVMMGSHEGTKMRIRVDLFDGRLIGGGLEVTK